MARYAIIRAGVVQNVVLADTPDKAGPGAVLSDEAGPGDVYSSGQFARPAAPVPDEVSMLQFALALDAAGIDETDVDALFTAPPVGPRKREARLRWKRATTVRRHSPLVTLLANGLGLTGSAVDDIFRAAQTL